MLYLVTLLLGVLSATTQDPSTCLTPTQDRDLKTSIMAIDATLKITVTALNISAMWKNGTEKDQLLEASRIISAVDTNLVSQMTKITEETCGTCKQIVKGVNDIVHALENTLSSSVPEWKTNPIYNSVVLAVNSVVRIVPVFCNLAPSDSVKLMSDVQCLTPDQDKKLKTSIMAIDGTLKITVTSLNIAAMWQNATVKAQLEQAATIISSVDTNLVEKMTEITEKTCGTCSQITTEVNQITTDLENTLSGAVPDWKTNPVFMSVTMALNGILAIIPNFCPTAAEFLTHRC